MEPFDPGMFPHSVYFLSLASTGDPTASTKENFPTDLGGLTPLPCRIRSTITRQASYGPGEGEVSVTEARIAFPTNPGCKKSDRFQRVSDGLLCRALGPARARDGDGVLFVVETEVID